MVRRFTAASCLSLLLTACTTYQVTPTTNAAPGSRSGVVDVLFAPPARPYTSVGIVSARKYKPGFVDPTTSDAIPQLQAAGAQVGADAVIVRSSQANDGRRLITVEGEAIRYNDVSPIGSSTAAATAAPASPAAGYEAALRYAAERGCASNGVSMVSGNVYRASCSSTGRSLIIQCQGQSCKEVN